MPQKVPRCFISYSHDGHEHKAWVRDFAARLRADGIDVILDQWDLVPGEQIPHFMETAVRESDFVLVICTPRYKGRSEKRQGGVGYEGDIMTGEVMSTRNQRKFIPVIRAATPAEATPTWLGGKYYVDLSAKPYSENQYSDLLNTLCGTREQAPPLGRSASLPQSVSPVGNVPPHPSSPLLFEPIEITGVIVDEVGSPRNDGTRGCALYRVPFRLSAHPPSEWAQMFVQSWNNPSRFTTMHRPGIASVEGDKAILDGTTVDEVEQVHRETLVLATQEANRLYVELLQKRLLQQERERKRAEEHRRSVEDAAKRIRFD